AMTPDGLQQRLSRITTLWTLLRQAGATSPEAATAAQQLILQRYRGAVYAYLKAVLGDAAAADDLTQEFGLCLVKGEFRHASPERGRFRNYVKAVLFHLVSKYRKRQQRGPQALAADHPEWADLADSGDDDGRFDQTWRDELLARTWAALADAQPAFFTVLHFRAAHPDLPSAAMAEALGRQLGKPLTADAVRQTLRRPREKFTELLNDEVARTLEPATPER